MLNVIPRKLCGTKEGSDYKSWSFRFAGDCSIISLNRFTVSRSLVISVESAMGTEVMPC
jgi:hypothetical protein